MRRTPLTVAMADPETSVSSTTDPRQSAPGVRPIELQSDTSEDARGAAKAPPSDAPASGDRPGRPAPPPGEAESADRRPIRWLRGGLTTLGFAAVAFCLMASERHWRWSVAVGVVALLGATWGALDWVGAFDDEADPQLARKVTLRQLAPRVAELVASFTAHLAALTIAVAGIAPAPVLTAAVIVTASFLWVVVAVYRTGVALGGFIEPPDLSAPLQRAASSALPEGTVLPLTQRHGFWLVVLMTLLYLPMLGSYSLSDPWETHYGEVAREMLARDDWISTWWAQDGWFWSKPVFDFWVQALSFSLLGVRFMPDEMIRSVAEGHWPQPEWAARMPIFIVTLAGAYLLYKAIARVHGRRAGFLSGLVLTTCPYWYLISHQTMTDMPYVGTLTAAMGLFLLGFHADPEKRIGGCEIAVGSKRLRLSLFHLVMGAITICALPQILLLLSRNVTLHLSPEMFGFRVHADEFFSGSGGGNCGLPGNQACQASAPFNRDFTPLHGGLLWALALGLLLWFKRGERRLQRLYFLGAWFFVALSAMAKGAPGLVLPIATVAAYVFASKRYRDIERLELPSLLLVVACVTLPWYVQMYMRHGPPFFDRLIMHDMYKRAFVHVHDTNQGDDVSFRYYVWQLGYGLFPWTGVAAGGLLWWLRGADRTKDGKGDVATLLMMWFIAAFGMFTITLTKFHHYIFPLVPPTAALAGIVVDRAMGAGSPARPGKLPSYLAGISTAMLLTVYGILRLYPRQIDGEALVGDPPWRGWGVVAIALGLGLAVVTPLVFGRRSQELAATTKAAYERLVLGFIGLASAAALALAGRDLAFTNTGDVEGQMRLMQLFTYNYKRAWPDTLDFSPALIAFTVVSVSLSFLWAFARWRRHASVMLCATAVLWGAWGVNIYLVRTSPHWGQRETVLAYYEHRAGPNEPLVAYQMNWKGENFYTGNKIPAFVSSGKKFKDWVAERKAEGVKVMYFTTEHSRMGSLKRELDNPKTFEKITDEELNNKFFLGRVQFED